MDTRTNENNDNVINVPAGQAKAEDKDKKSPPKMTILEQLKEEISKEVTRPDIEMEVPERAGVTVRFSPNISNEQLKSWRRNSTNRKTDELDSIKFSSLLGISCKFSNSLMTKDKAC